MGDLSKNFGKKEFACKCGCGANKVDKAFIWKLQYARDLAGIPFPISSGCRCPAHNKREEGRSRSDHLTTEDSYCEGADIACDNSASRFKILSAALSAGFRRIGVSKEFVHLGNASHNPQNVLWTY